MTVLDFMKKMQEKIPSNAFTSYSVYAEVDPEFMVDFGDASPIELAQIYGAAAEEISELPSKRMSYDGYGEFDEIDIQGDFDVGLACNWLEKKFKEGKLNSFWPVTSFVFDRNIVFVQPNGMIDNGKFAYDGMTLHEFMSALSQFIKDEDPSLCQIALPQQNSFLAYGNAKVDTTSHKVIFSFK